MLTSAIVVPAWRDAAASYFGNVGAAGRRFLSALLAVRPENKAATGRPVGDEWSLYRLYCLASRSSSHDMVSPELINELRLIAARG